MLNYNKISKLQGIAEGTVNASGQTSEEINQFVYDRFKKKIQDYVDTVTKMYPNLKHKQHEAFVELTKDIQIPNDKAKEYYWNKYMEISPFTQEETKNKLINRITTELGLFNSPTEKEHFLRDGLAKWPNWLTREYTDDLKNYSVRNADSNLNKAKLVYTDDLSKRLNTFLQFPLDPDVAQTDHVNDFKKLEQEGLLNVAKIINGRVGVVNSKGVFIPASDFTKRSEVFESNSNAPTLDEKLMVSDLSPPFIENFVKTNLTIERNKINTDNKVTEGFAGMLLDSGALPIENWKNAFSMFEKPEYTSLIKRGIIGHINNGQLKNDEEVVRSIWQAMNQYKEVFDNPVDYPNLQEQVGNPYGRVSKQLQEDQKLSSLSDLNLKTQIGPGSKYHQNILEGGSPLDLFSSSPTNPDYIQSREDYNKALQDAGLNTEQMKKLDELNKKRLQDELLKRGIE